MFEFGVFVDMAFRINFKKPVTTRAGSPVRIYMVYKDYIHGAYQSGEDWYIAAWSINGFFLPPKDNRWDKSSIDLINNESDYVL